jgi:hypothetical protein
MRVAVPFALLLAAGCASSPVVTAGPVGAAQKAPRAAAFKVSDVEKKSAAELDALFGAPALTRKEGAGEFRRYAFSACSLIVILYPDDRGVARASHISTAALVENTANPTVEDCLAAGIKQ